MAEECKTWEVKGRIRAAGSLERRRSAVRADRGVSDDDLDFMMFRKYIISEGKRHALDHASMHISPGEFVSINGPSGSGKSTA